MTRSTLPPSSPISLFVSLMCVAFACATSLNKIEHCELDCASSTVEGLNVVGDCEPKCSQGLKIPTQIEKEGQDAIKEYLDTVFSNALFGGGSIETGQNKETQIEDKGEKNVDADKSAYTAPKEPGVEHKLAIPSHIEEQGEDAIKEYLDNLFSNALFGTDSTQTGHNQEARPDRYSVEPDSKTQIKHEGESMNAQKSSYKLPKEPGEEQLLDGDLAVNVDLEIVGDGEYVLKIKRVNPSLTNHDEVERAKHMAQNGAMLLHYGEILQDMGEKLISQSQASLYSVFKIPTPPKLKSDQ
uniref:Uncharacterized protein n=1 Tax=Glycine max TaxID=3847 RepID=K7KD73_SOYBN